MTLLTRWAGDREWLTRPYVCVCVHVCMCVYTCVCVHTCCSPAVTSKNPGCSAFKDGGDYSWLGSASLQMGCYQVLRFPSCYCWFEEDVSVRREVQRRLQYFQTPSPGWLRGPMTHSLVLTNLPSAVRRPALSPHCIITGFCMKVCRERARADF